MIALLRSWGIKTAWLPVLAALLPLDVAVAQDNAGIFFYGPAPSVEQITAAAKGARTEARREGDRTRITASWPDVTLVISIDPSWNRDVQLSGMRGWIGRFGAAYRNSPDVGAFLADLDRTTASYGSVTTPAFDRESKAVATLLRLLESTGGFLFSHQSFYDSQGRKIIGLPGDPQQLGPRR